MKNILKVITLKLFIIFVITLSWYCITISNNNNSNESDITFYKMYTIQEGDTLWNLADELNVDNHDKRVIIDEIKIINNLESAKLIEGDTILLPEVK